MYRQFWLKKLIGHHTTTNSIWTLLTYVTCDVLTYYIFFHITMYITAVTNIDWS